MPSQMGNDGSYSLTVTLDVGTDLNTALVMVQNRVALALPQLPSQVQNQGITIRKKTPDILMIVNFFATNDRYDDIYVSSYAAINVRDELLRVPGVSDVNFQGQRDYSIRAWLDPQQLASRGLTAIDVATAIRNQNLDAPAGQIGRPPALGGQAFQLPVTTLGRLHEPEQFGDIIVKVTPPRSTRPPARVAAPPRAGLTTPDVCAPMSTSTDHSSMTRDSTNANPAPGVQTGGGATSGGGGTTGGAANTGGGGTTGGAATTGAGTATNADTATKPDGTDPAMGKPAGSDLAVGGRATTSGATP